MDKTVVINSVHTDSVTSIKRVKAETVISFDAHPDLGHWRNLDTVIAISQLHIPEKVKTSIFRASIQALLRASLPRSQIVSVVPEACVITHFNSELQAKSLLGIDFRGKTFTKSDAISWWNKRLRTLSIKGFTVPPAPVESLLPVAEGNPLVFDIDADYLFELTRQCHTPAGFTDVPVPVDGIPQDNVGSTKDVLHLISLKMPDLITLSELTYGCLKSKNRRLKQLLDAFEKMGYRIENGTIYTDAVFKEIMHIKASFDGFCCHRADSNSADDFLKAYLDFFDSMGLKY